MLLSLSSELALLKHNIDDHGDAGVDDGDPIGVVMVTGTVVVMLVMVMSVVRIIGILMLLIMVTFDMSMGKVCFDKTIHSELCSPPLQTVFGLLLERPSSCLQSEGLQDKRALAGLWGRRSPFFDRAV